jgi:hypothetical protein
MIWVSTLISVGDEACALAEDGIYVVCIWTSSARIEGSLG